MSYLLLKIRFSLHILTRDVLDLERTEPHENMFIIQITQHNNSGRSHSHVGPKTQQTLAPFDGGILYLHKLSILVE